MKYRVLVLLSLFTLPSLGQMKQSTFVYGPKAGIQTARLSIVGENPQNTEQKLAMYYQGGIFTRLNFGKFSIQPEFIYSQKGGNFEEPQQKHTFRYLATPVLFGYSPLKGVNFEVGPEFAWSLNTGWKKEGITQFGPDIGNETSIVVGTRIDMLDMFSMFSLNLRYTYGLTNTTTRVFDDIPLDYRNRTIQLSVTYNFSEYYKWWKKYGIKKKK